MSKINFKKAETKEELEGILELQRLNYEDVLSPTEAADQGFVTVRHSYDLLLRMNENYSHIIAKDKSTVIGYALVMERKFEIEIPILNPMFERINSLYYNQIPLKDALYFIMGQVCIDKAYRGKSIFLGLFNKMREEMSPFFDYIITEVATRNPRSLHAHYKVGFKDILRYTDPNGEEWVLILWDWS